MLRTATLALMLASGSALAVDDFARLAPPNSGLLVSVADYAATKQRLLATPMGRLTEHPQIKAMFEEAQRSQMEQFERLTTQLGLDIEQWPEPEGMVGLAVVTVPNPDAMEWEPAARAVALLAADFGSRTADVRQILDAVVDRGLDQGRLEIRTQTVGDVEVLTITPLGDDDEVFSAGGLGEITGGLFSTTEPFTVAVAGSLVFVSELEDLVVDAVDRHRGADLPSAAESRLVTSALAQHPDDSSDYLIVLPGPLGVADLVFSGLSFFLPPGFDLNQLLAGLGISGVKAISLALHTNTPSAQAEFTLGVLDPDRTGIVSLLDTTGQAWDPPSFVTPDATAATRLLVRFDRLPGVLRDVWATLPPDIQMEGDDQFELAMGFVEQIAPLLGPEVHIVQSIARPFNVSSGGVLFATRCSNDIPINNLLSLGAQAGLSPRQIAGATVYDLPIGEGALSLSVAYGHVFVGLTPNVESALRLAAAGAAGGDLSEDPDFTRALRPLPATGNALQFTRTLDIIDFMLWSTRNINQITLDQLRAGGASQQVIDQYREMQSPVPDWVNNLSLDTLARGVGDISMEITPAPDGFRGRILFHPPRR